MYAAKTYEDIWQWKNIFDSYNRKTLQIVKVKYDGNSFLGNGDNLPKNDAESFLTKLDQARQFWSNNSINHLPEMLIDGEVVVIDILNEYE